MANIKVLLPNGEEKETPKPQDQMTPDDWKAFFAETDSYLSNAKPPQETVMIPGGETRPLPKPQSQMNPDDWKQFFNETDNYIANRKLEVPPVKPDIAAIQSQRDIDQFMGRQRQPEIREARPSDSIAYQGFKQNVASNMDAADRAKQAVTEVPNINDKLNSFRDQNGAINQRAMLDAVNDELKSGGTADWFFKWYPANMSLDKMIGDVALEDFHRNGPGGGRANSAASRYAAIINKDKELRDQGYPGSIQDVFSNHPSVIPNKLPEVEDLPEVIRSPLADVSGALRDDRSALDVPVMAGMVMSADDTGKIDILDKKLGPFSDFFEYHLGPRGEVQVNVRKGLEQAVSQYEQDHPPTDIYQFADLNALKQIKDGSRFYVNRPGLSRQDVADFVGSLPTQIATALPAGKIIKGAGFIPSILRGALSGSTGSVLQDAMAQNMGSNEDISTSRALLGGIGGAFGDTVGSFPSRSRAARLNAANPERVLAGKFDRNGNITPELQNDLVKLDQGLTAEDIANLGPEYVQNLKNNYIQAGGDLGQAIRRTDSLDTNVPLTVGQLTRNKLYSTRERQAGNNMFGSRMAQIMEDNLQKQQQALMNAGESQLKRYNTSSLDRPVDIMENVRGDLVNREEGMRAKRNELYNAVKAHNTSTDNPLMLRGQALYDLRKQMDQYLRKTENMTREIAPQSFHALDSVDDLIEELARKPDSGISKRIIRERAPHLTDSQVDKVVDDFAYVTKHQLGERLGNRTLRGLTEEEHSKILRDALAGKLSNDQATPEQLKKILSNLTRGELEKMAKNIKTPLGIGGKPIKNPKNSTMNREDLFDGIVSDLVDNSAKVQEVSYADLSKIGNRIRNLRYLANNPRELVHLSRLQTMYDDLIENKLSDHIISGDPAVIGIQKEARKAAREHAHIFGEDSFVNKLLERTNIIGNSSEPISKTGFVLDPERAANAVLNLEGSGLKSQSVDYVRKLLDLQKLQPDFSAKINDFKGALVNNLWRQSLNKAPKEAGENPYINGAALSKNIWDTLRNNKTTFDLLFSKNELADLNKLARIASAVGSPVRGTANPSGSGHLVEQMMNKVLGPIAWATNVGMRMIPEAVGGIRKSAVEFADKPIVKGTRWLDSMVSEPVPAAVLSYAGTPPTSELDIRKRRKKSNPTGLTEDFLQELERMGQ